MKAINVLIYSLLISAFLIPREYNLRLSGISVSVTDLIFVSLLIYFAMLNFGRFKELIKDKYNKIVGVLILYLISIAIAQMVFSGVESRYFFLKHFYSYLTIVAFLVSYNLEPRIKLTSLIVLMYCLYFILSLYSIAIFNIPFVFEFYAKQFVKYKAMAREIGYGLSYATALPRSGLRTADMIGGFGHLAWASLICLPLFAAFMDHMKKYISSTVFVISFIPILMSVFYLMSRSNIISLLIVFIMFCIFRKIKPKILFTLFTVFLLLFISTGVYRRVLSRFSGTLESLKPQVSLSADYVRIIENKEALKIVLKYPVLGVGLGNFMKITHVPYPLDSIDSLYLTTAMKIGLFGMLGIVLFLIFVFVKGYFYLLKNGTNNEDRSFVLGIVCMFPAFFVSGILSYPFHSLSFCIYFWFILGLYVRIITGKNLLTKPFQNNKI